MKGFLVRVGIDSSDDSGHWNAPIDVSTNKYAYVPIIESEEKDKGIGGETSLIRPGYEEKYIQFQKCCKSLNTNLPAKFIKKPKYINAHLDPDFRYLTYGDQGERGKPLFKELGEGDIIVFYTSFEPISPHEQRPLVYAIIGLYILREKGRHAKDIKKEEWHFNAHTRREPQKDDFIFFGKKGKSGRLETCIPIGERDKNGKYYLRQYLYEEWGGFEYMPNRTPPKDNRLYIQRSGALPCFTNADKFYEWFQKEIIKTNNKLLPCNNLC
ncbi:MAG: hypothetical protein ABR958_09745 [Dehalococcoidales bacterium]|jgi:hypothetical protein